MDVELLEESCDPLHMPCVLKVEILDPVDQAALVFQYQQEALNTVIDIKSEKEDERRNEVSMGDNPKIEPDDETSHNVNIDSSITNDYMEESEDDDNTCDNTMPDDPMSSDTETVENSVSCNKTQQENTSIEKNDVTDKYSNCQIIKCQYCELSLDSSNSLEMHVQIIHNILTPCDNKETSNRTGENININNTVETLTSNLKENSVHGSTLNSSKLKVRRVKCSFCNLVVNGSGFGRHLRRKHNDVSFNCAYCTYICVCKEKLTLHIRAKHLKISNKISYTCDICQNIYSAKYSLDYHRRTRHDPKKILEKIYSNKKMQYSLKCVKCNKLFSRLVNFNYHLKYECSKTQIHCTICENTFKCKTELENHVSKLHSNLKLSTCEYNQLFIQKASVNIAKNNRLNIPVKKKIKITKKNNVIKRKRKKCFICYKLISETHFKSHITLHSKYLACDICPFKTQDKLELVKHLKKSHIKIKTQCKICSFKAEKYEDLKAHIFYVHDGNTVGCKYCDFQSKYQHRLNTHLKHRHKKKVSKKLNIIFKCDVCDKSFLKLNSLENHIKVHLKLQIKTENVCETKKKLPMTYTCTDCNRWYSNFGSYKLHKRTLCNNRLNMMTSYFYCDLCQYKSHDKGRLKGHIVHTHRIANKLHKCKVCGIEYVSKHKFLKHLKTHDVKNKPECKICGLKFSERYIEIHMKNIHKEIIIHTCIQCNETFDTKLLLHRHKRAVHKEIKQQDPNLKPFKCDLCNKSFRVNYNLISHKNTVHTLHNPVVCEECGKLYKNQTTLNVHVLTQHNIGNSAALFPCNYCDKIFKTRGLKNSHEIFAHKKTNKLLDKKVVDIFKNIKSKAKPKVDPNLIPELTCQICGKVATSKCNLRAHMYAKHSDSKPFKCEYCDRRFKYRRDIKVHTMTHTNEKPFKCPSCDYASKTLISLRSHVACRHSK